MITYKQGNLLEDDAEVLVNTVNTVGVMGKGIALMFKERFPKNFREYASACAEGRLRTGKVFVTSSDELDGPKWIVNFPTKQHWRPPSKMEWIEEGLRDLHRFLVEKKIKSVAIPPLGSGNGGLDWEDVRPRIEALLSNLDVDVRVYEPTEKYQNVAKRSGVEKLTPARALIAELVRRYWILGMECSLLEIQKLAWFLEQSIERYSPDNPLDLRFTADRYGPYANRLSHLLNSLDGSYLHCDKRIADASPFDVVWFDDRRKDFLLTYLKGDEAKAYVPSLEHTAAVIDGFESPYGMELLATVDWLVARSDCDPTISGIRSGLQRWPAGTQAAERKNKVFDDRSIGIAIERLQERWWK